MNPIYLWGEVSGNLELAMSHNPKLQMSSKNAQKKYPLLFAQIRLLSLSRHAQVSTLGMKNNKGHG
jgi:hypothetical protein